MHWYYDCIDTGVDIDICVYSGVPALCGVVLVLALVSLQSTV